jgi:hypothetical protein
VFGVKLEIAKQFHHIICILQIGNGQTVLSLYFVLCKDHDANVAVDTWLLIVMALIITSYIKGKLKFVVNSEFVLP